MLCVFLLFCFTQSFGIFCLENIEREVFLFSNALPIFHLISRGFLKDIFIFSNLIIFNLFFANKPLFFALALWETNDQIYLINKLTICLLYFCSFGSHKVFFVIFFENMKEQIFFQQFTQIKIISTFILNF